MQLASEAAVAIMRHAQTAAPRECCGLLLGAGDRIVTARPTDNVAADPLRHFEIDPAALISAERAARGGGVQVLGYYHSHPRGPVAPSRTDRAMAPPDGRVWIIAADGALNAYRAPDARGKDFVPIALAIG